MAESSVIEAVRQALREEMSRDPMVFVMGEDVGQRGGVFLRPRDCWKNSEALAS